jgi:hypothetical protein
MGTIAGKLKGWARVDPPNRKSLLTFSGSHMVGSSRDGRASVTMAKNAVSQMADGSNRNAPLQLSGFAGLPSANYPTTISNDVSNVSVRRNFEFANAVGDSALHGPPGVSGRLFLKQINAGLLTKTALAGNN